MAVKEVTADKIVEVAKKQVMMSAARCSGVSLAFRMPP